MKQLIGKDIGRYSFSASARQITFYDITPALDQILTIVNVKTGVMIYCFAAAGLTGDLVGRVLTLNADTTAMADTDVLQIYADLPVPMKTSNNWMEVLISGLMNLLRMPPYVDPTQNAMRTVPQSIPTIANVTTLATCSTVSNVTQIDSMQGRLS